MSNLTQKFLNKSWVNGLGGLISFSIAIAIDCASLVPITMGIFFRLQFHLKLTRRHHFEFDCMKYH